MFAGSAPSAWRCASALRAVTNPSPPRRPWPRAGVGRATSCRARTPATRNCRQNRSSERSAVRRSPNKARMYFWRHAIERDSPAVLTPSPPARAPRAGRSPQQPTTKAQIRYPPLALDCIEFDRLPQLRQQPVGSLQRERPLKSIRRSRYPKSGRGFSTPQNMARIECYGISKFELRQQRKFDIRNVLLFPS